MKSAYSTRAMDDAKHPERAPRVTVTRDDSAAGTLAAVRIVLIRTSHPGNIGAAARAMLTMGVTQLALVEPRRFPDPEALAMASGATAVLDAARVTATLDAALAGTALTIGLTARPREFAGRVLDVRAAAAEAVARTRDGEVAIVFGTEMSGLTNEELARCSIVATIPSNPVYGSLNLAAAVQVMTYELRMAAGAGDIWHAQRFTPASDDEIEGVHRHAEATLARAQFLDVARPRRLMVRLRRLFARAGLEKEEVNILRGILARIDELVERQR